MCTHKAQYGLSLNTLSGYGTDPSNRTTVVWSLEISMPLATQLPGSLRSIARPVRSYRFTMLFIAGDVYGWGAGGLSSTRLGCHSNAPAEGVSLAVITYVRLSALPIRCRKCSKLMLLSPPGG